MENWIVCKNCKEYKPASKADAQLCARCAQKLLDENPPTLGIHVTEVIRTDDHAG